MRGPQKFSDREANQLTFDTDIDRYPKAVAGLRRVLDHERLADVVYERIEIQWLASGEGIVRLFKPRADDSDGFFIEAPK